MQEMSSLTAKHMKTMCYTSTYNFVNPEVTLPLIFNMAAGGHLGFSKMLYFVLNELSLTIWFNSMMSESKNI